MRYTVLLDSPSQPAGRVQIAQLGEYSDGRYGDFNITAENVENWQTNLSALPGGEALIDFEHRSERKPRDSKAAGWITSINLDGEKVMADVRWTPDGRRAIKDGSYRFMSPAYGPHTNERGETFDDTLMSAALTNKPALTGMAAVVLASEERVQATVTELEADNDRLLLDALKSQVTTLEKTNATAQQQLEAMPEFVSRSADSRPAEMDTAALTKLLDLPADADQEVLAKTIEELQAKANRPDPKPSKKETRKSLEQEVADKGLVLLDQKEAKRMRNDAAAGALALKHLHDAKFDTAFEKKLAERIVVPAERDDLKHLYTLDAEATLRMLEAREPIMAEKPSGAPSLAFDPNSPEFEPEQFVRSGIDPESVKLDSKIRAHMSEHKLPESAYLTVLDQVSSGQVIL